MQQFQVFLSYARADDDPKDSQGVGPVERFKLRLESRFKDITGHELSIFFDRHIIKTADDWEAHIRTGLRESRAMIALLSPSSLRSEWCQKEWITFSQHEAERFLVGEGIHPIVIAAIPDPTGAQADIPKNWREDMVKRQLLLSPLSLEDWLVKLESETLEQSVGYSQRGLVGWLSDLLDRRQRAEAQLADGFPKMSDRFVGRGDELRALRAAVQGTAAIVSAGGIGGVGKTELARAYGHAFAYDYPGGRFFIEASHHTELLPLLASHLGPRLGVDVPGLLQAKREAARSIYPPGDELEQELAKINKDGGFEAVIRAWWEKGGLKTLVVLDNVEPKAPDEGQLCSVEDLRMLPDPSRFDLLVTTRSPGLVTPTGAVVVDIGLMSEQDALELISIYRPLVSEEDFAGAREILRLTGRLTLAVKMAAVYLERNPDEPIGAFAERLQGDLIREFDLAILDDAAMQAVFAKTDKYLSVLFDPTLKLLSAPARRAVDFAAHMGPDAVYLDWVIGLVEIESPLSEPDLRRLKRELRDFRILEEGAEPGLLRIHRVLQAAVIHGQGEGAATKIESTVWHHVLSRVEGLFTQAQLGQSEADRPRAEAALALVEGRDHSEGCLQIKIEHEIALWSFASGDFHQAKSILYRSIGRKAFGSREDPCMNSSLLSHVAILEYNFGNLKQAKKRIDEAIELFQEVHCKKYPRIENLLSVAGEVERLRGNMGDAQRLLAQSLEIMSKKVSPESPDLSTFLTNLAIVERQIGHVSEARSLLQRAISIEISNYGPACPNLATIYSNLGNVELDMGNLSEAKELLRKTLAINASSFGNAHPKTSSWLMNLAVVEQQLGEPQIAKQLTEKAMIHMIDYYGPEYPGLARCYSQLGASSWQSGDFEEARQLHTEAIRVLTNAMGPDHPDLATHYSNLAVAERSLGNLERARELMLHAIKGLRLMTNIVAHPLYATFYNNLAKIEFDLGHSHVGCDLMRKAHTYQVATAGEGSKFALEISNWLTENCPDCHD